MYRLTNFLQPFLILCILAQVGMRGVGEKIKNGGGKKSEESMMVGETEEGVEERSEER